MSYLYKFSTASMSSGFKLLRSLFQRRSAMSNSEQLLLDPTIQLDTSYFSHIYSNWAETNPDEIISRFEVQTIMHNKMTEKPEHEYLLIETLDQTDKSTRFFILERTVREDPAQPLPDLDKINQPQFFKRLYEIAAAAFSTLASAPAPSLASVEEGRCISSTSLTIPDAVSLSSVESADLLSDLSDGFSSPAHDRILGSSYAFKKHWHGRNVQFFKPNRLNLFEFIILAQVVHTLHPNYSVLRGQCYFYAALVYEASKQYFKVLQVGGGDEEDKGLVYINDSRLSNRFGRYHGYKINWLKGDDVEKVISAFKKEYAQEIGKVIFFYLIHSVIY